MNAIIKPFRKEYDWGVCLLAVNLWMPQQCFVKGPPKPWALLTSSAYHNAQNVWWSLLVLTDISFCSLLCVFAECLRNWL